MLTAVTAWLASLADAELIARYEAARVPRTRMADLYRVELERRARARGVVRCEATGRAYRWDEDSESVVCVPRLDAAQARAHAAEHRRLAALRQSLGRAALEGPGRGRSARPSPVLPDRDEPANLSA